jgi:hypothetical protein
VRKASSEDSDSDQGALTIAEDHDTSALTTEATEAVAQAGQADIIQPKEKEAQEPVSRDGQPGEAVGSQEEKARRADMTKELLKNIVATLDPAEARKLILKAKGLEKIENFTLRELKEFLSVPSVKKAKKKTTEVGSPPEAAPPTEGRATRRSGRLRTEAAVPADQSVDEKGRQGPPDSDSEVETFVIEPKEMKRKKRRGVKKKAGMQLAEEEREEDLQDSAVTSSNIVESSGESSNSSRTQLPLLLSDVVTIKTEPIEVEEEETEQALISPRLRQTRARAGNNNSGAPPKKTKTWFPGELNASTKALLPSFTIKTEPVDPSSEGFESIVPKREPLAEPDIAVFTGQGQVADINFGLSEYAYNPGRVEDSQSATIRLRHAQVSDLFHKLKLRSQEAVLQRRASPLPPAAAVDSTAANAVVAASSSPLPSKVKLFRPPLDETGRPLEAPALLAELTLAPPSQLATARGQLIDRLAQTVGRATADRKVDDLSEKDLDQGMENPPGLLRIVKEIRRGLTRPVRPLPALIPLDGTKEMGPLQLPLRRSDENSFASFSSGSNILSLASLTEFKTEKVSIFILFVFLQGSVKRKIHL